MGRSWRPQVEDGIVVIWDAATGKIAESIRADDAGEQGGAFNLDFSPDGLG